MQTAHTPSQEAGAQLARTEGYLLADPDNTDLLARAIDQCLAAGELARAQRHAEAALARYPDDPFFRYRQAHVLGAQRQWRQAGALFETLLAGHGDVNIACSLANCQVWMGQHQQALTTLAPYRDQADLPAEAVTLLVRALHHTGELVQALALAAPLRERLASAPDFLAATSLVYLDQGELAQARAWSSAALALNPAAAEAMVVRATLSLAEADSEQAIACFKQVLEANPEEGRSWSGLGLASLLKRDLGQAALQLEQAAIYLPRHIGTLHGLAWCKLLSRDLDAAEAAFKSALALDRNVGDSHGGLAVVAALKGERDAAQASIARALGLDRDSLAAGYAQMLLSGAAADPARCQALVFELMGARKLVTGELLADVVRRHAND